MDIKQTPIYGVYLLEYKSFIDNRGELIKPFSYTYFDKINLNIKIKESWFTKSNKNVIRGMHIQIGEPPCDKIISTIQGEIVDVIIDLRPTSPTYLNIIETILNDNNYTAIYIPSGCAHGYKSLQDNSIVFYMANEVHSPINDKAIKYNSINYNWNVVNPILSDRDLNSPPLVEFIKKYNTEINKGLL